MKTKIKNFLFLHVCIFIYTLTTVTAKITSDFVFLSFPYLAGYAVMVAVLGFYALLWQQAIKPLPAAVSYSNKSFTVIWTLVFSTVFFDEKVTVNNVIGAALIVCGVFVVAKDVE